MRTLLSALTLTAAASTGSSAFLSPVLPGLQETSTWTDVGSTSGSLSPTGSSDTSIAVLAPGFRAGLGFYAFSGNYQVTFANADTASDFGVRTVVLQLDIGNPALTSAPTLEFGSEVIPASLQATLYTDPDRPTSFGPVDFYGLAFQWDLTGLSAGPESFTLRVPLDVHTSFVAARIDLGDTFLQVVPEPGATAAAAGVVALTLASLLRSRRTCGATRS